MSFNRENIYHGIDMNGNTIKNVKPEYLSEHPSSVGLFKGYRYFNTTDNVINYTFCSQLTE